MSAFELREEIDFAGRRYFLQTSFSSHKKEIRSSFFKSGALFDTLSAEVDDGLSEDELKESIKRFHLENKRNFLLLLKAREKIKSSIDQTAHLRVAQALFARNLFSEAIQEAQGAVKSGNSDSMPYVIIGESYYKLGEYEKARQAVHIGIDVNPEYPDIHNLMGKVLLKLNRCREAVDYFNRAKELNMYYGEPYLNLARAFVLNTIVKEDFELSKDLDAKVKENLDKAVQLDPDIDHGKVETARKLFAEKNYEEFLEVLESVKDHSKMDIIDKIFLDLYLMTINGGDEFREEEIEHYLKIVLDIVDRNPTYADGFNSLGILYTAKCKILMDRASEAFEKALEINKNYKKAKKNLRLAENDRQGIFILLKALLD